MNLWLEFLDGEIFGGVSMKPKVSVIMPVYNGEKFLSESIESLLNQTYKDFELLLINDGSTDTSLSIINNYQKKDDRIKVISRGNKGLVASLNEGIELSQGEFIARMDADDVCFEDRFAKQVELLEKRPDIDIVGSKVELIGDVIEENKERSAFCLNIDFDEERIYEILMVYWYCLAHPSLMFRKSVINRIGFYRDYTCEDFDLLLRAVTNGCKIYKIGDKLIKYRKHNRSKSYLDNIEQEGLRQKAKLKMDYILKRKDFEIEKYLIWGTGTASRVAEEVMKEKSPTSRCTGYIDPFKSGINNGLPIYQPQQLNLLKDNYVIIATEPGKVEAIQFLDKLGLLGIQDYITFT